jgi:hypothetical protein
VPASFTPVPEQFEAPVSQNQRTEQAQQAQGFALTQINYLENQLHKGQYKRDDVTQTDEELKQLIVTAKTTRTVMADKISEWAGNLSKEELETALPVIWAGYMDQVQASMNPTVEVDDTLAVDEEGNAPVMPEETEPEDTPADGEVEPIDVLARPVIADDAPRSKVEAPEQLSLGDVLSKIEESD